MIDAYIGRTPLVRLERVVGDDMAEVWVKVEGMNPGGSIKDRTALALIVAATLAIVWLWFQSERRGGSDVGR